MQKSYLNSANKQNDRKTKKHAKKTVKQWKTIKMTEKWRTKNVDIFYTVTGKG